MHLHSETEPRVGHEIAVVSMTRTPRLVRIISKFRSLLPPVDRLDRHVDVQDPRLTQDRFHTGSQFTAEPRQARRFLQPPPRSPHYILTDRSTHPQQWRV